MKFYTNFFSRGDLIYVTGYDNNKKFLDRVHFKPKLFVPSRKQSKYKTMYGENVESIEFGSMSDGRDFIKKYTDVEGFKIYGSTMFSYVHINEDYGQDFDTDYIKIAYLDIEVMSDNGFPEPSKANSPITAISFKIKSLYSEHTYVYGCGAYNNYKDNVTYHKCKDEMHLLQLFLEGWETQKPDIVTGWNVNLFDIPYIHNRAIKILNEKQVKKLSPFGIINERKFTLNNKEETEYELAGISTLDYLDLYKKFTYSEQESYKLDHIAFVELGERKLDYSEVQNLNSLYLQNYQKFIDYNIRDVELVYKLEDKMHLIEQAMTIAYDAKVNYSDVFSQVRLWDALIHNYLMQKNIVIPPKQNNEKTSQFAGAYVKEPKIGMHDWIISFDLDSLYPHLIMQYNISPETFVENDYVDVSVEKIISNDFEIDAEHCLTASGFLFRRDKQGFLAEMMQKMYDERSQYKRKMLEAKAELETINRKLKELA